MTARNEEQAIQDRCLKAGIKLLPKSLVNYVRVSSGIGPSGSSSKLGDASMVGGGSVGSGLDLGSEEASKLRSSSPLNSKLDQVASSSETLKFGSRPFVNSKLDQVEETRRGEGEAYNKYVADADTRSGAAQSGSNLNSLIVLIDDDKLFRYSWEIHFQKRNLPFRAFKSIEDFLAEADSLDKNSKIYIDSDLGDDIVGEIESEKIFNLGFLNLYMATGYKKSEIKKPHWIKEIYSKNPENVG